MSIFQNSGVDTSIDPQTIPPIRRDAYIALREAQIMCEQAESNLKSANDAVVDAVRAHDAAQAALPRRTFMQEWRASRS
jgi:hypothetical protein